MEKELLLEAFERILLIRRMEEAIGKYFFDNRVMSFIHLSNGQEVSSVSVALCLDAKDQTYGSHRGHGLYLSRKSDPKKLFAELLGKSTGYGKGNSGSMHCIDRSKGLFGCSPLLGAIVPVAVGAAFAQKLKGEKAISVAFCGEGGTEEGVVYESANLAATWNVPFMLVIENNLYSVMSHLEDRRSPDRDNKKLYEGLGCNYLSLDGNNFESCYPYVKAAVEDLKNGSRPYVVEMHLFRHKAHSSPLDNFAFRRKDTKEIIEQEDCLKKIRQSLVGEDLSEIENRVEQQVQEAIEFGVNSPEPLKEDFGKYLYA